MENKKLGIAIIGAGAIAGTHIDAYMQFPNRCEVRAVCRISLHIFWHNACLEDAWWLS